jgi:hypothetical protein
MSFKLLWERIMTEEYSNNDRSDDMKAEDQKMDRDKCIISHSGPAALSSRFFIARGAWGLRIAFVEQHRSFPR